MKIFITGGTGFVGSYIADTLAEEGHSITILSRRTTSNKPAHKNISFVEGNPQKPGNWTSYLKDHEVIINLAGASIFTRWNKKAKIRIKESRILTTQNIVNELKKITDKEITLINASAVGYYGCHNDDAVLSEDSPAGNDFLAEVSKSWEYEAFKAQETGIRVIICRFGIVLGNGGGALEKMLRIFRIGAGSPLASGKQWFSWVHIEDLTCIISFIIQKKHLSGIFNCTAPNPVTNKELTKTLAKILDRPAFLPAVPAIVLNTILGEFASVLVKGQRAYPKKLIAEGFEFQFPILENALHDLLNNY